MKFFEGKHHAALYAKYRPAMPQIIVDKAVEFLKKRNSSFAYAVDVGCGNGQSTFGFGRHFSIVLGVDTSSSQISEANLTNNTDNVKFEVGDGEKLSMSDSSVDLISSCMAVHWFDLPVFFEECTRVLRHNGCLLLSAYTNPGFYPKFADLKPAQAEFLELGQNAFRNLCSKYKFHERVALLDNQYQDVFEMLNAKEKVYEKDIELKKELSLEDFLHYLSTWSPYQNYMREEKEKNAENQVDVLDVFATELKQNWNMTGTDNKQIRLYVIWKYFVVMSGRPGGSE